MPVVMTEWGHLQDDATYATVYSTCLESYLTSIHGGWMVWVLAGSYYIRQGVEDEDETWGTWWSLNRHARNLLIISQGCLIITGLHGETPMVSIPLSFRWYLGRRPSNRITAEVIWAILETEVERSFTWK
jgi:hypothetical protein